MHNEWQIEQFVAKEFKNTIGILIIFLARMDWKKKKALSSNVNLGCFPSSPLAQLRGSQSPALMISSPSTTIERDVEERFGLVSQRHNFNSIWQSH